MEEVLIVVLGAVLEILVEVLASVPCDWLLWIFDRRRSEPDERFRYPVTAAVAIGLLVGAALGGLSLAVHRKTMLPYPWLRILNVIAAPTVSGLLARRSAQRRSAKGQPSSPHQHFAFAFALTFALAVIRFVYGVR